MFMEQLAPTKQPLRRIKLKIFGSSNSGNLVFVFGNLDFYYDFIGKTTLVDSLKCTFLNSFFRRNRLSTRRPSGMKTIFYSKGNISFFLVQRKSVVIDESEVININSSKGVGVQQITCTGN